MPKRLVLVRPSGPRNAGLIVRTAANFGPVELCFVAPEKPSLLVHPEFTQMSHGVEGLPERVRVVATLPEALADCTHSYGFTARVRDNRLLCDWRAERERMLARCAAPDERVALVFGSEVSGLSGEECDACTELVRLPTGSEHTSLNLAMAAGVVLFSLFEGATLATSPRRSSFLTHEARRYLIDHMKDGLGEVALSQAAQRDIRASIERVFARAPIETRDARAWHAILRALGNRKRPSDYGHAAQPEGVRRSNARARAAESPADEAAAPGAPGGEGDASPTR
jgi:TrmH family RNA methyltransferase